MNVEVSWLLAGQTADPCFDRLMELAIRANAVSAGLTQRKQTQGASIQTTRINCRGVGQTAAVQCVQVAVVCALAERQLRVEGRLVRCPTATNAIDPCLSVVAADAVRACRTTAIRKRVEALTASFERERCACAGGHDELFGVVSTSHTAFNVRPVKLSATSVCSVAHDLAVRELRERYISSHVASSNYMLDAICQSVLREETGYDSSWASVVLLVYLAGDPRGRCVLRSTSLTDVDLQIATVLEAYGRTEVTRRSRLRDRQRNERATAAEGDLPDQQQQRRSHEPKRSRGESDVEKYTATCSDASVMLRWWYETLRGEDRSVLYQLIASKRSVSSEAAAIVVEEQAPHVASTTKRMLRSLAREAACVSAVMLLPMLRGSSEHVPRWLALRNVDNVSISTHVAAASSQSVAIGLCRSSTHWREHALYACRFAPVDLRPSKGLAVLWSEATHELAVRSDVDSLLPCVLERHGQNARVRRSNDASVFDQRRTKRSNDEYLQTNTIRPTNGARSGRTRSFVALATTLLVRTHTLRCADSLVEEARVCLAEEEARRPRPTAQSVDSERAASLGRLPSTGARSVDVGRRHEPFCLPAPRLAVGLRVNELLRRLMVGRTRKNDPCRVHLGCARTSGGGLRGQPRETSFVCDSEPVPLATIVDFDVRVDGVADTSEADSYGCVEATAQIALHVCLDGAVRTPEMIAACDGDVWQQRGLLYASSSQASWVGETGAAISAGCTNSAIHASRKISCADVTTLCLLSAFDVYGGGITNVEQSLAGSSYCGVYGPRLDTGITSVGFAAHNVRSDKRGHGSMALSEEVVDELALQFAARHFVDVDKGRFAERPVQTDGVPNGYIPGVHSVTKDYVDALERIAVEHERDAHCTLRGLFSLPFSAFTQALRPDIESTVDCTLRHDFREVDAAHRAVASGRSYIADSTHEDEALVTEPFFRRPCQASSADNPFATSYEHVDSLFNALCALALVAERCGGVAKLHALISRWHAPEPSPTARDDVNPTAAVVHYQWAADACVLVFGAIYPCSHRIDEPVVHDCYARACASCAARCRDVPRGSSSPPPPPLEALLDAEGLARARALWARFSTRPRDRCPWHEALSPMLQLLLDNHGSHDVSAQRRRAFRSALETVATRGAWLAYSEDGVHPPSCPNPAHDCATPADVRRPTIDPVYVAHGPDLQFEPRGCLVGLKPFQLRQLYSLLLGAHLPGVEVVQAVRNEGGLLLRGSSLSLVLKSDGRPRSSKSISPTQTESDGAAYGTREAKMYGASLQCSAWDRNVKLQAPLYLAIEPPADYTKRNRGQFGDPEVYSTQLEEYHVERFRPDPDEVRARRQLEEAAASPIARLLQRLGDEV